MSVLLALYSQVGSARSLVLGEAKTRVGSAVNWEAFGRNQYDYNELDTSFDMTKDFHTFKLEWTPDEIVTSVDDIPIFQKNIGPDFCDECEELHQPYFFVVNVAVGGGYTRIYHEAGITAPLPAEFLIDYIRIYDNGHTKLSGSFVDKLAETTAPTDSPTTAPTDASQTSSPTKSPTLMPSLSRGEMSLPTESPTGEPAKDESSTFSPTTSPTAKQSPSPTAQQVSSTSSLPIQHLEATGIKMTLTNVEPLSPMSAEKWAEMTRVFLMTEATTSIGRDLVDTMNVTVSLVSQDPPFVLRRLRAMQQTTLDIDFNVVLDIQSVVDVNDLNRYIVGAFHTYEKKTSYLTTLQATDGAFMNVDGVEVLPASSVSRVVQNPPNTTSGIEGLGYGLIIGIALAALAIISLTAAILYSRWRHRRRRTTLRESTSSGSEKARHGDDDDSMYNLPVDTQSTCEDSLYTSPSKGTLDYDLQGAFKISKQPASVGSSDSDFAKYIDSFRHKPAPQPVSVCDSESEFTAGSETYNYSAAFKNLQGSIADSQSQMTGRGTNDDLTIVSEFEVKAPPGNLGIVLESADDGVPVVQEVYRSSPLVKQVNIGDRLLSVDGRDVTMVMASTVSRIIASKKDNAVRRFVFARPMEI